MKKIISMMAIATGFSLMAGTIAQAGDITESRDLSSFQRIIIEDAGVGIDVVVGKDFSVIVRGGEKWVGKITTTVEHDALVISRQEKKKKTVNFGSDNRIIITMPSFTGLEVKGAVDADISGVDGEKLDFEIDGAGNIEIKGRCGRLKVDINGAGNFEGRDLKCEDVRIKINGAGNVEAYGSKSADLEINGFGNIDLYGKPEEINKDKSWFSNITVHK